ncbi:MAG: hypothetical protein EXX96DRAFT_492372, partial [Benjaminiella poitrasii]
INDILSIDKFNYICLHLSIDEFPQFILYLDRLYNVAETIYKCCYNHLQKLFVRGFGSTFAFRIIKAITERSTDGARRKCFYYVNY